MIFLRNYFYFAMTIACISLFSDISSLYAQRINDIEFFDIRTNNVAYLDAFPKDSTLKLRITGTDLGSVRLMSNAFPNDMRLIESNAARNGRQLDIIVKFSRAGAKTFNVNLFNVVLMGATKPLSDFQRSFVSPPICQIYDKPTLQVDTNSIINIYDRPTTKDDCGPLSTGSGAYITTQTKYCLDNNRIPNPTAAVPLQEDTVLLAPIKFDIVNKSFAPIFTPFKVQIKRGINTIKEFTINRLLAKGKYTIEFHRSTQNKIFARHLNCRSCYEKQISGFNDLDDELTIVIDPEDKTKGRCFGAILRASKP